MSGHPRPTTSSTDEDAGARVKTLSREQRRVLERVAANGGRVKVWHDTDPLHVDGNAPFAYYASSHGDEITVRMPTLRVLERLGYLARESWERSCEISRLTEAGRSLAALLEVGGGVRRQAISPLSTPGSGMRPSSRQRTGA